MPKRTVKISEETYQEMVKLAEKATESCGMTIDVDTVVETSCQNRIQEESPTGRKVTFYSE